MKVTLVNFNNTRFEALLENETVLTGTSENFKNLNQFKNHVYNHVAEEYMDGVEFQPTLSLKNLKRLKQDQLIAMQKGASPLVSEMLTSLIKTDKPGRRQKAEVSLEEAMAEKEAAKANIGRWVDFEEHGTGLPLCGLIAGVVLDKRVPMVLYRIFVNGDKSQLRHKRPGSVDMDFNEAKTQAYLEEQLRIKAEKEAAIEQAKAEKEAAKAEAKKLREEAKAAKKAEAEAKRAELKAQKEAERLEKKAAADKAKEEKRAEIAAAKEAKKAEVAAKRAQKQAEAEEARKAKQAAVAAKKAAAKKAAAPKK